MAQRIKENRKGHLQEKGSRYSSTPRYSKEPPGKLTKLRGGQGWKDKKGNIWKKDRKHKDHYDVTNPKTGKRLMGLIIMVTKYRQIDLKIKTKIIYATPMKNTSRIKPGVYLEIEGKLLL